MAETRLVAIHQPNFLPWLGYFEKIMRANVFVYLDHTKNNPRTASWYKRVNIIANKQEFWLSVPLKSSRDQVFVTLNEMEIDSAALARSKGLKTIEQNYRKAPHFSTIFPIIERYFLSHENLLVRRNLEFIEAVCKMLHITTLRIKSSDLHCATHSNELLIEIITQMNGTAYLCGGGAEGYQDDELFHKAGLDVVYQNFRHPVYPQFQGGDFKPGLSIIDALMNCGILGTRNLLLTGRVE